MSQPRRTIEQLIQQEVLPIAHADAAATHLNVYPSKPTWLAFFDKAALIIGAVALVLSLVFFIAYNWLNMGKIGKFVLVEGLLVITIAFYTLLAFWQKFKLAQQLLLLIASIITGSLLALFGQVYQTGADTWQLFFNWALLIIPWVLIARLPALWLLWLGLINSGLALYLTVTNPVFVDHLHQSLLQAAFFALLNFLAFTLWLRFMRNNHKSGLHWSAYVVGLMSTFFITYLAAIVAFDENPLLLTLIILGGWASWCAFIYWRFSQKTVDVLMLTYGCFSIIVVVMFWAGQFLLDDFGASGFLSLALLLIAISSAAVVWLRTVIRHHQNNTHQQTNPQQNNNTPPHGLDNKGQS